MTARNGLDDADEAARLRLRSRYHETSRRLNQALRELERVKGTRSWKLTSPLRALAQTSRRARELGTEGPRLAKETARLIEEEGMTAGLRWLANEVSARLRAFPPRVDQRHQQQLADVLATWPDRQIIVSRPFIDWDLPLFQRPQHLAASLAREGFLYVFATPNRECDAVDGFVEMDEGCVVTSRFDLVDTLERRKTYHVCSSDMTTDQVFAQSVLDRGDVLLYDYLDELHSQVSGHIPPGVRHRHAMLLADDRVPCVASSSRLLDEVRTIRTRSVALVTNGVDYEHFSRKRSGPPPPSLARLAASGRPVLGYFGALASWFDYELVRRLAEERPSCEVLLIGPDYDGSAAHAALARLPNVTLTGPVDYQALPWHAQLFDVAMIPFKVNEITEATSPIKLFEYMALGVPIVTTALPECRKYTGVLVAEGRDDFCTHVDAALRLQHDAAYLAALDRDARANTWAAKAAQISTLLHSR